MTDIISPRPLTLYFVGMALPFGEPTVYTVADRPVDGATWSFVGSMTVVERAALRALCEEALSMLEVEK